MGHGGDVIHELTTDHREVEEMFARFEALPTGDGRRKELVDQVTIELVRHSVAEEMHLYPAVRKYLPDGDSLADKELEDHSTAERTMKELEACEPDDPRFDQLMTSLMSEIREHVADEENNLFRGCVRRPTPRTWRSSARRCVRPRRRPRPGPTRPPRTSRRPTSCSTRAPA